MILATCFTVASFTRLMVTASLATLLSACGGDDAEPGPNLKIRGTAAVGAAMINRPVAVVCKSGTGAGLTDQDGRFAIVIENATGPCMLSATVGVTGGATLRSVAHGDGSTANITPLTELLVQYLTVQTGAGIGPGVPPASLAANPRLATVLGDAATLQATVNRVIASINTAAGSAGVTLVIPTDFLQANLIAKSLGQPTGNEQDVILDTLRTRNLTTALGAPADAVVASVTADARANVIAGAN